MFFLNLQSLSKVISWLADADMAKSFLSYIYLIGRLEGNLEVFLPNRLVDCFLVWQENGIHHHLGKFWSQAVKSNKIFISKNWVWETCVSPLVKGGGKAERKQGCRGEAFVILSCVTAQQLGQEWRASQLQCPKQNLYKQKRWNSETQTRCPLLDLNTQHLHTWQTGETH